MALISPIRKPTKNNSKVGASFSNVNGGNSGGMVVGTTEQVQSVQGASMLEPNNVMGILDAPVMIQLLPQNYFQKLSTSGNYNSMDKLSSSITLVLQQIDKHFSDCHQITLQLAQKLIMYRSIQLKIQDALSIWNPLFKAMDPMFPFAQNRPAIQAQSILSIKNRPQNKLPETPELPKIEPSYAIDIPKQNFKGQNPFKNEDLDTKDDLGSTPTLPSSLDSEYHESPTRPSANHDTLPTISRSMKFELEHDPNQEDTVKESGYKSDTENVSEDSILSDSPDQEVDSDQVYSIDFSLDLFPNVFQSGIGAEQLTKIYDYIIYTSAQKSLSAQAAQGKSSIHGITMDQLVSEFPEYGSSCIQILLDMMVRKRVLFFSRTMKTWYK